MEKLRNILNIGAGDMESLETSFRDADIVIIRIPHSPEEQRSAWLLTCILIMSKGKMFSCSLMVNTGFRLFS